MRGNDGTVRKATNYFFEKSRIVYMEGEEVILSSSQILTLSDII
jgi:hypothetical protein